MLGAGLKRLKTGLPLRSLRLVPSDSRHRCLQHSSAFLQPDQWRPLSASARRPAHQHPDAWSRKSSGGHPEALQIGQIAPGRMRGGRWRRKVGQEGCAVPGTTPGSPLPCLASISARVRNFACCAQAAGAVVSGAMGVQQTDYRCDSRFEEPACAVTVCARRRRKGRIIDAALRLKSGVKGSVHSCLDIHASWALTGTPRQHRPIVAEAARSSRRCRRRTVFLAVDKKPSATECMGIVVNPLKAPTKTDCPRTATGFYGF